MKTHITKACSAAFYPPRNIRRIRKYLSQDTAETLIHSFAASRINHGNSLLFELPSFQISKIQRVQNAAACVIFMKLKYFRITPLLKELHWLPVTHRIKFKHCIIWHLRTYPVSCTSDRTLNLVLGLTMQYC